MINLIIENFEELDAYLNEHPDQARGILPVLEKAIGPCRKSLMTASTEENFIRLLYHLDEKMALQAEVLRFIATCISPFFGEEKFPFFSDQVREVCDEAVDEFGSIESAPPEKILTFLKFLSKEEESQSSAFMEENFDLESDDRRPLKEEASQQERDLEWEEEAPESPKEDIHVDMTDASLMFEASSIQELPVQEEGGLSRFLKRHEYFLPQLKSSGKWGVRQGQKVYRWLKNRRFFYPHVKKCVVWSWTRVRKVIHWVRDEQEFYVWLRRYQKGQVGYRFILSKKSGKARFHWAHREHLKKVYECDPKDAVRVIKGILTLSKLSREERDPFNKVKDLVLMHEQQMLKPETILDIINYGDKKFRSFLRKISHVSNRRKLNLKLEAYLLSVVEGPLLYSQEIFRKGLEKCNTYYELKEFILKYPLFRISLVKRYKPLEIILVVRQIILDFERHPDRLEQILNQHFGTCGEANLRKRLPEILVNSKINEQIWEVIEDERYLEDLLQKLAKLQEIPVCRKTAEALLQMIKIFMAGESNFSYVQFKAGINFVPIKLQHKILTLVREHLQEELSAAVNTLIVKKGKHLHRLAQLRKVLKDPKYDDAGVYVFGYPPSQLEEKISSIQYEEGKIGKLLRHVFTNAKVPDAFLELVEKAKKAEKAAEERNIPNCLQKIEALEKSIEQKERVNLHKMLSHLFKMHGQVNFAEGDLSITGYEIAEQINKFYATPNRTVLSLEESIVDEVKIRVERMVNREREKQLLKMAKDQESGNPSVPSGPEGT